MQQGKFAKATTYRKVCDVLFSVISRELFEDINRTSHNDVERFSIISLSKNKLSRVIPFKGHTSKDLLLKILLQ